MDRMVRTPTERKFEDNILTLNAHQWVRGNEDRVLITGVSPECAWALDLQQADSNVHSDNYCLC